VVGLAKNNTKGCSAERSRRPMELIGFLAKREYVGVPADFIFARNVSQMSIYGVSLTGIDGFSFFPRGEISIV
jgi:hypothetical protein